MTKLGWSLVENHDNSSALAAVVRLLKIMSKRKMKERNIKKEMYVFVCVYSQHTHIIKKKMCRVPN